MPAGAAASETRTRSRLSPLGADETARLLAALLRKAVLPADTQALLLEQAGGNPLYAEEFVRMLTDQGVITAGRRTGRRRTSASRTPSRP